MYASRTFRRRAPISDDAASACWRRRALSAVSTGRANVGELSPLDISVGGVEVRETGVLELTVLGEGCRTTVGE